MSRTEKPDGTIYLAIGIVFFLTTAIGIVDLTVLSKVITIAMEWYTMVILACSKLYVAEFIM